jgi:SAM-dependent methyltransferase
MPARVMKGLADGLERLGLAGHAHHLYERIRAFSLRSELQSADDLPLPPRWSRMAVAGTPDASWFLESGRKTARMIADTFARHGQPIEEVGDLLDFGCGCGRVVRHWRALSATSVHGTDFNARLISWCTKNLTFADFSKNELAPPLRLAEDRFDAAYAFSVFTHLPEELTLEWLAELSRVLRPGGLLVVSTHGEAYADRLSHEERERFLSGEAVIHRSRVAGTNLCTAFHPANYVRARFTRDFELLEHTPAAVGARVRDHDLAVLRKPETATPGRGSGS